MHKARKLIRQVYDYEKTAAVENKYLSNVMLLFAGVIFSINFINIRLNKLITSIFCCFICMLSAYLAMKVRRLRNRRLPIKEIGLVFLASSSYCLYWGGNEGFQNLWFFLLPFILLILVGLPIGVPLCGCYGFVVSLLFWTPLHRYTAYTYLRDYSFYYPLFYWSFFALIFVADIFYKQYRISQERSEEEMKQEVERTVEDAQKLMINSVAAISRMIDEKDSYTRQHSQRVAEYSKKIAERMEECSFTERELQMIYRSALLHDIGKIAIPDAILNKPAGLTEEEYEVMKTHTVWGRKILAGLKFLPQADYGASYHHERYDGKGYPEGIHTGELPQIVAIISAADALDAMNSNRCYRKHCGKDYIIEEFKKGSGTQFDPHVTEVVIRLVEEGEITIA